MNNNNIQTVQLSIKGSQVLTANIGESLLKALNTAGILFEAVCGGQGTCGKCRIRVLSGEVVDRNGVPVTPDRDGTCLACQVYPSGDLVLDRIERAGVSAKGEIGRIAISAKHRIGPVNKRLIRPSYPTLARNYSLQEMVSEAANGTMPLEVLALQELALVTPEKASELTLVCVSGSVTAVEQGNTTQSIYGIAFDIGSTTVAGLLLDGNKGEVLAAAAETNPQAAYGADVISRINAAGTAEGLQKLSTIIRECLNRLIVKLCAEAGISSQEVYAITVAGNSTMEHLLMGISPTYLTISPYVQTFKYLPPLKPQELALDINPGGRVLLLPNIASFVGADTVAGAMAVDQDLTAKMTLFIDLGTNGEIVLGNKHKLLVSSTAAGPAFEGAQLACGMRAAPGAIEDVTLSDDVYLKTINDQPPAGICGSGIIKLIAEFLRIGLIVPSGRLISPSQADNLPEKIRERLREREGRKEFVLAYAEQSATGSDVVVTQGDIREIQLVKSSICTGSQILMEGLGVTPAEVDQVLIAGAFGNYIDLDSALAIGLIPVRERGKIRAVGNAAGEGAAKALLSEEHFNRCRAIADKAGFVELANHTKFQDWFVDNLSFP